MEELYRESEIGIEKEKTPIPSRYDPKTKVGESRAWTNAHRFAQNEVKPEEFPRVERSPYVEDVYMETHGHTLLREGRLHQ